MTLVMGVKTLLNTKELINVCTFRKYKPQSIIFNEGELGTEIFIILSGSVRMLISALNGDSLEIGKLKSGDIFGEMSLLKSLPQSFTVETLEETTTIVVDADKIESVIKQHPFIGFKIIISLTERIGVLHTELVKQKDPINSDDEEPLLDFVPPSNIIPQSIVEDKINVADKKQETASGSDNFVEFLAHSTIQNKEPSTTDSKYLYEKEISCPVCGQTIHVNSIRSSKLILKRIDPDYRRVYNDFEPLWYSVWVCPYCYYANFNKEFLRISEKEQKRIKRLSKSAKDIFGQHLDGSFSLVQVLNRYFLLLFWFKETETSLYDFEKIGKIFLMLSWLYHDIQEIELSLTATKNAIEYFVMFMDDITVRTTATKDQYLCLLLGELNLKIGNIDKARNYFYQSLALRGGNVRMKQQAQNRIQDLKIQKQQQK
jgi:uncharacterized protein (DUF2225 family)